LAAHDPGAAGRILAAAGEPARKRGVEGLTVAEIAKRAGVGRGPACLRWETWENLVFELFARDCGQ
jgi:tetracycline repressor-like protein